METDADRRFRRLAAAIAADADSDDDIPGLELDVKARTFTYRVGGDPNHPTTRRVTIREHMLHASDGIGEIASHAWGQELSDEEGWLRFTLGIWDETEVPMSTDTDQWWTFGAGPGIAPVPPWQAADYTPSPDDLVTPDEPIDRPPNRRKPRRGR